MCGICGIFNIQDGAPVDRQLLMKMSDALISRGPDDQGLYCTNGMGMAMRRLKVIDLEGGHQPMHNEDKTVWVVYNGEIYNFRELRLQLETQGHTFLSDCDTEVIIHAYEQYGESCVSHFNGMFAFALYDSRNEVIMLARDRMGIKPLYYYYDRHRLVYASEIKAILHDARIPRDIDIGAVDQYFSHKYIRAPRTIYRYIRSLEPGTIFMCGRQKEQFMRYWDIPLQRFEKVKTEHWYAENLLELLTKSVKRRMVSDVPLGAFLSGGIDSSVMVALMSLENPSSVRTFSIGFDDESYNELNFARQVADTYKTLHHEIILKPDIPGTVTAVARYLDQPHADCSIIPTYIISQATRQQVTVALSGDGGDELFAGYDHYKADLISPCCSILPAHIQRQICRWMSNLHPGRKKKELRNIMLRFCEGLLHPQWMRHMRWMTYLTEHEKQRLFTHDMIGKFAEEDVYEDILALMKKVNDMPRLAGDMYIDLATWLPHDILTKVDMMSMAHSLEVRVPFLDYEFVEFCQSIPPALKMKGMTAKYILKKAVRSLLPEGVYRRTVKQGFSMPVNEWLRGALKELFMDTVNQNTVSGIGIFDYGRIDTLVKEHMARKRNNGHVLWAVLMYLLWHKAYAR